MVRPMKRRMVGFKPGINYFKPAGIPMLELEEVVLTVAEFEAVRLKDLENMDQIDAAKKMDVSQPTFNRILSLARKKIADALANGKAIRIEGGSYVMAPRNQQWRRGRGRGFRRQF